MGAWTAVGVVAGTLFTLGTLTVFVVRIVVRISAPHFAKAVRTALDEELSTIREELRVNGGKSLKDVVHEIHSDLRTHLSNEKLERSRIWEELARLGAERRRG